jgi:hypothetical protein
MQIEPIEEQILNKLTFAESLESLFEEIDQPNHIISDVLKQLIRKRLVATVKDKESKKTQIYYDSDHMDSFAYIITASGLNMLGH